MSPKFCPYCGKPLAEGANFCVECGQPITVGEQPVAMQRPIYAAPKPKVPGRGLGIASMVLGIIGLVYALIFLESAVAFDDFHYGYYIDGFQAAYSLILMVAMLSSMSIMALVFGRVAAKRGYRCGVSTSGTVMGIIGIVIYIASIAAALAGI